MKKLTEEELAAKFKVNEESEPDYKAYLEGRPKTFGIRYMSTEGEQRLKEVWAPNEVEARKVFLRMGPEFKGDLDVLSGEEVQEIRDSWE
ncbi:hypothetical protein [Synechococcus phage S-H38]|uniref:Uncharacterized protein n=1 Tax=Synechococcus phage S-H38 TaxID=2783673 RepID=A0A873WIX3_9CAUD|nr:hypothetical protein PQC14_gp106 [Synechococcus phage S-H38]QPB07955.1 hypothetical protein [Synechococcus phage S-H38]